MLRFSIVSIAQTKAEGSHQVKSVRLKTSWKHFKLFFRGIEITHTLGIVDACMRAGDKPSIRQRSPGS